MRNNTLIVYDKRNIVAHIYIDHGVNPSYSRWTLDWPRLFLFPLYLIGELFNRGEFHFCRHEIVTNFAGYIVQEGEEVFRTVWHDSMRGSRRVWRNIERSGWRGFLPSYVKKPDHSCWCTREGDAVAYIPISKIGTKDRVMKRYEFLRMADLTEDMFMHHEDIKYTGR